MAPRTHLLSRHGLPLVLVAIAIAITNCSKQEDNSIEANLARAQAHLAANQDDKAEKEYRTVLARAASNPVAIRQLAIFYHDQGQLVQAYPLLKRAIELHPSDAELQLKLALTLMAFGQLAEAREAAQQVLETDKGNDQALLMMAETAVPPAGTVEETRAIVEAKRSGDQDRAGYHLAFGALDLKQNRQQEAEREFKEAIRLDPKSGTAHAALGLFYWRGNDLKAAAEEYKLAAEVSPLRSPLRLRYPDFLLRTGAAAEAKTALEEINSKLPSYLPAQVLLMRTACSQQQTEECAARVQTVLSRDVLNYEAVLQDSILNLAKGEVAKAIRELEQLSTLYNRSPQVRYQLGVAYLQSAKAGGADAQKAIASADSNLTAAVQLAPQNQQAVLLLSELKIRRGAPTTAIDLLTPLVRNGSKAPEVHYMLASAFLAQQNSTQALATYQRMTELFPRDPQPYYLIGRIFLTQQKNADARAALEKSAETSKNFLPAIEQLVILDLDEQKPADALKRVQAELDKDPKLPQLWALRGRVYLAQRDFAHAEPDFLKAIELDPKLETGHLQLAALKIAANQPEQAVAGLEAFIAKNKSVPALMMLAGIHEKSQNFTAAKDSYEKVLAIAENNALALNNLAVIYSDKLGQLDKAYGLAKRANELAQNEPHIGDTLGWILFKRGEYPEALKLLQESAAKLPNNNAIQFHLGSVHYMLGDERMALAALKKAVSASDDFDGKKDAQKRIEILSIEPAAPASRAALQGRLTEQPNDPMALFKLAEIQRRDGALDEAIKTYEKLLAANAFFTPATRRLAVLYSQRAIGDSKAFDVTQKAFQAYPDDADVAKALGILNYRREYYPRASDLLKQAAAKRNDDGELLYYLGAAQQQLKQWAECKATLERALSASLPSPLADKAKGALAECSDAAGG